MEETLSKVLLTGHFTADLDEDGQLIITEIGTRRNLALDELEPANTVIALPAQAAVALLKFLHHPDSRRRIGARQLR